MEEEKSLSDYGLTSASAKAQQPAEVGLAYRSVFSWRKGEADQSAT